mgnify:CR=1 FL=1
MELKKAALVLALAGLLSWAIINASLAISDRLAVEEVVLPGSSKPISICYGGGSIWVLDAGEKLILQVDPSSREVIGQAEIPDEVVSGGEPVSLASFVPTSMIWAYGRIWIAGLGLENVVLLAFEPSEGTWSAVGMPYPPAGGFTGGWCLASGEGSVWTLVDVGEVYLVEVDPGTTSVKGIYAGLPGGTSICYGAGCVWVLYTFIRVGPYGPMETSQVFRFDVAQRRLSLFTSRSGRSSVIFARGDRLYVGFTPSYGFTCVLEFDAAEGRFLGSHGTVPGVMSLLRALFVDWKGDIWFSQPGYFGVCGKRVWSTGLAVNSICDVPGRGEVWLCGEEGSVGKVLVVSERGLAGAFCVGFPTYIMGLPSSFLLPVLAALASLAAYALVDFVVGRMRFKKWLRERRARPSEDKTF